MCIRDRVSPDGVALSQMVSVSASVNLPLQHKVQKFSSGTAHPGGPGKRAVKRLWWWWLLTPEILRKSICDLLSDPVHAQADKRR